MPRLMASTPATKVVLTAPRPTSKMPSFPSAGAMSTPLLAINFLRYHKTIRIAWKSLNSKRAVLTGIRAIVDLGKDVVAGLDLCEQFQINAAVLEHLRQQRKP